MTHLMQLDRRIKSIQTTKKITHAMRLISMSLYARFEKLNLAARHYQKTQKDLLAKLSLCAPDWQNSVTKATDPYDRRPLIIFVSSIKGLCGNFNSNLTSYVDRFIDLSPYQTPLFISIGAKATEYAKKTIAHFEQGKLVATFEEINSHNLDATISDLTQTIVNLNPRYSSILAYSTKFENFFIQRPMKTVIVASFESQKEPYRPSREPLKEKPTGLDYIWEQPKHDVLNSLASAYIHASCTQILMDSLVAEQAARFLAMESATTNAEGYLEKLQLQYNKMRQELITKELAEISASL